MKKNMIFFTLPTVISAIAAIFLMPVYTLFLDPVHYGLVASVVVVLGIIDAFSDLGSGWVLAAYFHKKEINRRQLTFNLIFLNSLLRFSIIGIFFFLGQLILNTIILVESPNLLSIYHIILLSKLFLIMSSVGMSYLILNKNANFFFILEILSLVTCQSIGLWLVIKLGYKAEALAIMELIRSIMSFCFFSIYLIQKVEMKINKKLIKEIIEIGAPALIKTPSSYFLGNIEKFSLQYFIGAIQLGIFSHGASYKKYQNILLKSFNRVYGAEFIEKYTKNELDINRHIWFGIRWLAINFLISLGIILFIGNFIDILTHSKFNEARIVAELIFVATFCQSIMTFYSYVLIAEKKTKFIAGSSMIIGILSTGAVILSIYIFGWLGALSGILLSSALNPLFTIFKVKKILNLTFLIKEHLLFLVTLIIIFFLRQHINPILSLEELLICSVLYLCIFVGVVWKLGLINIILGKKNKIVRPL